MLEKPERVHFADLIDKLPEIERVAQPGRWGLRRATRQR
jgi:hypothetical protein